MPTSGRRSRGTSADGLRPADPNRPGDVPTVAQPNLADVPDDVLREMCPAVDMIKSHQWASLRKWLLRKLENGEEDQILATSEDDSEASRVNCLSSVAGFRPVCGGGTSHMECALLITSTFYKAGLINMKVGKSRGTALLACVPAGNLEVAEMLISWGGGIPPWFLSALRYASPLGSSLGCVTHSTLVPPSATSCIPPWFLSGLITYSMLEAHGCLSVESGGH